MLKENNQDRKWKTLKSEYLIKRPWLTVRKDHLATDVERTSTQHLDETEDISIELLTPEEVRTLLVGDHIKQALMAAPLWKYFAVNKLL